MQTPQQLAILKLTKIAKDLPSFHRLLPEELEEQTGISSNQWMDFISSNEEIRQFISMRTAEDVEFAHRAALNALAKEAKRGNVQAIKELNQLSGILNQNNNKQIVTHYIPRPTNKEEDHDLPKL